MLGKVSLLHSYSPVFYVSCHMTRRLQRMKFSREVEKNILEAILEYIAKKDVHLKNQVYQGYKNDSRFE